MRSPSLPRAVAAAAATVVALLAGACAAPAPAPGRITIVNAPTASAVQPRLTGQDEDLLRSAAGSDPAFVDLVVAGDPTGSGRFDLTPRRALGNGRSEVEHGPARDGVIEDNLDRVRTALAALAASAGPPDLLRAITDAARSGGPGTLLVVDSGVTTVDPLDLTVLGWDQDPGAVAADLRARGFLPDLRGWQVRFVGLGRVSGPQEPLPPPQQRWLEELWSALCRAGGAAGCVVVPPDVPAAPPVSTRAVPPVPVPPVTTVRSAGDVSVTTLPASRLGFTEGSAALAADADAALADVVAVARNGRHSVDVVGYVAFWGSESYRADLSTRRAQAVADRLVALGVPRERVTAAGAGAADGPEASMTGGVFDEAEVQQRGLRRVVVTVAPVDRVS